MRAPFTTWQEEREGSDYRDRSTQLRSFVRNQLSQAEYLRSSNRVNQGPKRSARAQLADSSPQIPHVFGSDDMWGWKDWMGVFNPAPNVSPFVDSGLYEAIEPYEIPGQSYFPYQDVGGASYIVKTIALEAWSPGFINYSVPSLPPQYNIILPGINGIPINPSIPPDGSLLMYDAQTNTYNFVSSTEIVGLSDGNSNSIDLDFGTY